MPDVLIDPVPDPEPDLAPASAVACAFVIPGDLTLPTGGYAYDRQVLAGLGTHGVAATHLPLPGRYPSPTAADLEASTAALARLPADTTLLIDGLAYGAFPVALLARIRQRVVALVHHPLGLEAGLTPTRAAQLIALETAALARADHIIVTSPLTKRLLVADFAVAARDITVAEPGTAAAGRAVGSRGGSGGNGALQLLAVGSIVPRKGYPVLIEALAGLRASAPTRHWQLRIVGSARNADEAAKLDRAITERDLGAHVQVLGALEGAALDAHYASSDLFVMPSLFEGYGMVLAEAMARGLPIVCTTGGAAAETVPDAAALKVPPGDAVALRQALARAISEPDLRQQLADGSWAAGQRLPRWDQTCRLVATAIIATAKIPKPNRGTSA